MNRQSNMKILAASSRNDRIGGRRRRISSGLVYVRINVYNIGFGEEDLGVRGLRSEVLGVLLAVDPFVEGEGVLAEFGHATSGAGAGLAEVVQLIISVEELGGVGGEGGRGGEGRIGGGRYGFAGDEGEFLTFQEDQRFQVGRDGTERCEDV